MTTGNMSFLHVPVLFYNPPLPLTEPSEVGYAEIFLYLIEEITDIKGIDTTRLISVTNQYQGQGQCYFCDDRKHS